MNNNIQELLLFENDNKNDKYWKQCWTIPKSNLSICGYSKAAYRSGFYIKELDFLLDAGPYLPKSPAHIFITHTHIDHCAMLPFTLFFNSLGKHEVYAPKETDKYIYNYVSSFVELNSLIPHGEYNPNDELYNFNGFSGPTEFVIDTKKCKIKVNVVICDHSVPTISYCFSEIKQKLKSEYKFKDRKEIIELRKNETIIVEDVGVPLFAYICDTSIKIFDNFPIILSFPVVFVECTFIYDDELNNAIYSKHIHWNHLLPYILKHSDITFVLIHFSLRYREEEIIKFFFQQQAMHNISNIKVWAGNTNKEWPDVDTIKTYLSEVETV